MKPKRRLDQLLLDRGLSSSRQKAQAMIMAAEVFVNGQPATKPGHGFLDDVEIEVRPSFPRFVSRGGEKLAGALHDFKLNPTGFRCLDIGASTGGFTDCLLSHGAEHVFALDVGRGQLDQKLRRDSRVTWRESFHVKNLSLEILGNPVDLAVVDVSFISLRVVLPFVLPCIEPNGTLLTLIKPQFEGTRKDVQGSGVVKSNERRLEILTQFQRFMEQDLGFPKVHLIDSRIKGTKGNLETFALVTIPFASAPLA